MREYRDIILSWRGLERERGNKWIRVFLSGAAAL